MPTPNLAFRRATVDDLPAAHELFATARAFMAEAGNPTQWAGGYPQDEILRDDIANNGFWIVFDAEDLDEKEPLAVFFFDTVDDDETYRKIDGAWLNDETFGVVHRIATHRGTHGIGTACIKWAEQQAAVRGAKGGIRIDTHEDNTPMRSLLAKLGYTYTGIIWTYDGTPRVAYQKLV